MLDNRCVIAHAIHITDAEVAAINRSGATVVFCSHSSLRLSSGVTFVGRHPDLSHVALGTDALNSSNHLNLLNAAALTCNVYAEARKTFATVTAERALEWLLLAAARAQSRILLTFDLDMGQLVFERRLGVPPGIIVIRDVPLTLSDTVQLIIALFDRQDLTFEGQFTVVTGDRIRQRPLPAV